MMPVISPLGAEALSKWTSIAYPSFLTQEELLTIPAQGKTVLEVLLNEWRWIYEDMTPRVCNPCVVTFRTFLYLFDEYGSLVQRGLAPHNPAFEPRLIAAIGYSCPQRKVRDSARLKGWVGPTELMYGKQWDKGHFMAHSCGGAVDQCELNVFVQERRLNRGWSPEGKRYREMEKYCKRMPGTLCFSRPLYGDGHSIPAMLEFGLLKSDGEWWVERFQNCAAG